MTSSSSATSPIVHRTGQQAVFALLFAGAVWLPAMMRCSIEWAINAQYYYGWAVPFLAAYLAYERMPALHAPAPVRGQPGARLLAFLGLIALAIPQPALRLLGEPNTDWRLITWLMAGNALGISFCAFYLAGGWPMIRRFAFPVLFLLTAVPWPVGMENFFVQGLMRHNAAISAEFVSLCGVPAIATGNLIELPTGVLGVNEACSGIRSLQSTLMASIFLGGLYQIGWGARLLLVGFGAGLAFVLNIVRTVFLSWQGAFHGIEATEKWHDSAGFAILGVVLVGLWLASQFLEKRAHRGMDEKRSPEGGTPGGKA